MRLLGLDMCVKLWFSGKAVVERRCKVLSGRHLPESPEVSEDGKRTFRYQEMTRF
jgi:hypothetical protein